VSEQFTNVENRMTLMMTLIHAATMNQSKWQETLAKQQDEVTKLTELLQTMVTYMKKVDDEFDDDVSSSPIRKKRLATLNPRVVTTEGHAPFDTVSIK